MSPDLPPGAVRAFYGAPQHETRPLTDPEEARVVTTPSPPTDCELHSYAERSSDERSSDERSNAERSSAERRRVRADALRRRVDRERTDGEMSPASRSAARGVMVRW